MKLGGHTLMAGKPMGSNHEGMSPSGLGGHTFMVSNSLEPDHEGMSPSRVRGTHPHGG